MNTQLITAGILGATAIGFGAYGAHGLEDQLAGLGYEGDELAHRLDNFITGSRYQLAAATALLVLALAKSSANRFSTLSKLLSAGAVVFCGLLYVLAFAGDNLRWLGAIVPIGGVAMIAAWAGIAWVGFKEQVADVATQKPKKTADQLGLKQSAEQKQSSEQNAAGLVRVEELLMHHQQTVSELNDVVTELRLEADKQDKEFEVIDRTVRRLVELQQAAVDSPDERPPHY